MFLALQHTTAGLLQYGGGSYQSGLVEEADGCLNLWCQLKCEVNKARLQESRMFLSCFPLNIYITRRHHSESVRKEICNTQKPVINKTARMFHEPIKDKYPMTRINRLTSFFIPYKHPLNALSVRIFTDVFPQSSHTGC